MKISITLVIILTAFLCVLPFLWFMLIGKSTSRKREKIFNGLIKEQQLTLKDKEQWNNNLIGIDATQKLLIFIKLNPSGTQLLKFNLDELRSCQIDKVTRDFKRDKKVESELQTMQLELTFANNRPKESLYFYDIKDAFSEDLEMKRAEKWQQIINQNIVKNKSNSLAA